MLEEKITRVMDLITQKKIIDRELENLLQGTVRKTVTCSKCSQTGHTARSCTIEHGTGSD
jgi:hypothetical protein